MSLENGDGILDYEELEACLEKYKKDNKVFEKAMILLSFSMSQPSWPHSFDEYEKQASKILGGSPYWIGRVGGQLESHFYNAENSKIDSNFKNDLAFFSNNTWMLLDNAYYNRLNPFSLSSISSSQDINGNSIVKISRNDKMSLELSLTQGDINTIINYLRNLISEG